MYGSSCSTIEVVNLPVITVDTMCSILYLVGFGINWYLTRD